MEAIIISNATLNPRDLLRAYAAALCEHGSDDYPYAEEALHYADRLERGEEITEPMIDLLDSMETGLNYCAPAGMYFGSLEGDAACIGFFPVDDE